MSATQTPATDPALTALLDRLSLYSRDHPGAMVGAYRWGPGTIHARVVDPSFAGLSKAERHDAVWSYLEPLSDDEKFEIGLLLLLTPQESHSSLPSADFDRLHAATGPKRAGVSPARAPQSASTSRATKRRSLSVLDGLSQADSLSLERLGVKTVEGLLRRASSPQKQIELSQKAGIPISKIRLWVKDADRRRLAGDRDG